MAQLGSDMLIGVVAGLVTTLFTILIGSYWKGVILPWYEEQLYRDAHIEGDWNASLKYPHGEESHFNVQLYRKGHRVTGQMVNKGSGKIYNLQGEFRNMILTLTYSATVAQAVDRGCFGFLLVRNGRELDGQGSVYYSPENRFTNAITLLTRADTSASAISSKNEIAITTEATSAQANIKADAMES